MLKKFCKIGMLFCALTLTLGVNAQDKEKVYYPEYPTYSFWSNWHIGLFGEYNWQPYAGGFGEWRDASNAGVALFFEKDLNYVWAFRLTLDWPSAWHNFYDATGAKTNVYDRNAKTMFDFKLSLNDWWRGHWNPESRFSWYGIAGIGLAYDYNSNNLGGITINLNGGTGISWDVCKHSTLFLEAVAGVFADPHNFFKKSDTDLDKDGNAKRQSQNYDLTLRLGYAINLGVTKADKERIAMRAMLTQENFDRLMAQNEALTKDLQDAKDREQKLINRIHELENELENRPQVAANNNDQVVDSLRKVIEGYEANKGNFYALPFSISYDVDQYTVSDDQRAKVKAIADLMKSDDSFDIEVIGYCDASGSDAYNQKLSERRAEQVKKLLVRYGVDESRITTSGKGKSTSFGDLKNAINRRCSFYRVNK